MSSGRSNKPLFEVLSQHPPRGVNPPAGTGAPVGPVHSGCPGSPKPDPSGRPTDQAAKAGAESVQAEPKPRVVLGTIHRPPLGRPEPQRPIRTPETQTEELDEVADAPPRPVVTIPLSTVYSAVALAGALILIAWIGGHTMGAASKQAELTRGVQPPDMLNEPTAGGRLDNPVQNTAQNPGAIPQNPSAVIDPESPAVAPAIRPSANGTILSAVGMLEIDPRESGLNYLELGTFSREMTQDAIDYLAANEVPSIGIPQPGGRYRLVSVGLGIPGGQWSAMAAQRTQHQKTVGDIGTRWVRDRQGGSDFRQTQWTKYQP